MYTPFMYRILSYNGTVPHQIDCMPLAISGVQTSCGPYVLAGAGVDQETAQKEYITLVKSLAEKYAK